MVRLREAIASMNCQIIVAYDFEILSIRGRTWTNPPSCTPHEGMRYHTMEILQADDSES